jgi:hypothetical protein
MIDAIETGVAESRAKTSRRREWLLTRSALRTSQDRGSIHSQSVHSTDNFIDFAFAENGRNR